MKAGIHPDFMKTKVTCSSCKTTFETMSTVPEIQVELCSNCHPFYTGKQKLVDTAGRVDRFRAQREKAQAIKSSTKAKSKKAEKAETVEDKSTKEKLAAIKREIKDGTKDIKNPASGETDKPSPAEN